MRIHLFLTGLFCTLSLGAQDLLKVPTFPSPDYFREVFAVPAPRVELRPPARLGDFVADGKLEISLRGYLELVLANNPDIGIQRLSVETQKNAITRAFARFDPAVVASFRSTRTVTPTNDVLSGAATLNQLQQPLSFDYQQTLETGTQYSVGFSGNKTSTNNAFATFNPALTARMNFSFTQPLLRGRGSYVNKLPVMIARSRLRVGQYNMEDQLMRLLALAENAYWSVVEARENLRVRQEALALAKAVLERNQRELELGAISPLDIYESQQNYSNAEVFVSQARYRLEQMEDALRRQMGADLDPDYREMPIVLTETVLPPTDETTIDKEAMVETAYRKRPDLKAVLQNLDIDDLNYQTAKDEMLPDLSLNGTYTSSGRGGTFFQRTNVFAGDGTSSTVVQTIPGGINDALSQVFGFNYPIYGFSLNLRLPIRNRRAAADLADALVSKKLNALRARSTEQTVRLDVLNAVSQLESSKASVKLAQVALDFSQKRVDAEQKKYDLGVTTIFFLLNAQQALTQAQADLVTQSTQYRRNLTNLLRVTGQLLEERGVVVQ
jgi:outer membrane protein